MSTSQTESAFPTPAQHNVVEGLAVGTAELAKAKREIRRYRWQYLRNRIRLGILQMHRSFLESFGLGDVGILIPSLLLGLPPCAAGAIIPLLFHASLPIALLSAGVFFAVTTALFGIYYWIMPYDRILREVERLREHNLTNWERLDKCNQHRDGLVAHVGEMRRAEMQRTHHQQQLQYQDDLEEAAKIQRLRAMLGYQQADPWGTVAIFFSCTALALAILGLFTCGFTYVIALPFACAGFLFALLSKGERRGVAVTLSLITFAPVILAIVLLAAR